MVDSSSLLYRLEMEGEEAVCMKTREGVDHPVHSVAYNNRERWEKALGITGISLDVLQHWPMCCKQGGDSVKPSNSR